MTYVIVTEHATVVSAPFGSFFEALDEATRIFGDDTHEWLDRNVRVEEHRPQLVN